ncbi:hypothetical protein V7056_10185 [Bacillus sp. JJ664]
MGLFINKHDHPDVYKNIEKIQAQNQSLVRHNALTKLIKEQQLSNTNLVNSIAELKPQYEQLEEMQTTQWNHMKEQINDLIVSSRNSEDLENMMLKRLHSIEESEKLLKESIIDQMNSLSETYQELVSRMEKNESSNEHLTLLLNKQLELQKEVADTLQKQEEFQTGVLNRLDNQEALTEKISRQLNHIRSIIFERTDFIATKLEDSYKKTSAYVYKLINGTEQSTYSTLVNSKKKKNQQNTD